MWYWGSIGVIARSAFGSISTGSHKPPANDSGRLIRFTMPGAPAGGTVKAMISPAKQNGTQPSTSTAHNRSQVAAGKCTPPSVIPQRPSSTRMTVPKAIAENTFAPR